jgi:hypothetical protein
MAMGIAFFVATPPPTSPASAMVIRVQGEDREEKDPHLHRRWRIGPCRRFLRTFEPGSPSLGSQDQSRWQGRPAEGQSRRPDRQFCQEVHGGGGIIFGSLDFRSPIRLSWTSWIILFWGLRKRGLRGNTRNNLGSFEPFAAAAWRSKDKDKIAWTCPSYRRRLASIVAASGDFLQPFSS